MMALVRNSLKLLWNHHSRLTLLLYAALLILPSARSQTNTTVSRDFNKEMAEYVTGSADTVLLPTALSTIPPWMYERFPEQDDTLYVFGISDPGLNDTVARQQAVFRALALGAMAKGTDCGHFSDFYTQEKGSGTGSKYEEIYRFSAYFSGKSQAPAILNDTILSSSEAVVLLGIPKANLNNDTRKNILIEAVLYSNEADIISRNKMSRKVDISIQKRDSNEKTLLDASDFYQINGKATGMRSLFPKSQFFYNNYEFYYTNSLPEKESDSSNFHGTTCKQGLWIAYVSEILEQLSLQTKLLTKESQVLRDQTEDTSTELLRERSRTRLSWRIKEIDIHDNKMWVNLTISKF